MSDRSLNYSDNATLLQRDSSQFLPKIKKHTKYVLVQSVSLFSRSDPSFKTLLSICLISVTSWFSASLSHSHTLTHSLLSVLVVVLQFIASKLRLHSLPSHIFFDHPLLCSLSIISVDTFCFFFSFPSSFFLPSSSSSSSSPDRSIRTQKEILSPKGFTSPGHFFLSFSVFLPSSDLLFRILIFSETIFNMCDEAARLAKIGRQEYDLIRIHDAPNCDDQTKFECDLELARFQVIRSQIALKNVYNEEFVTPAKLRYLRDDLEAAEEHLKKLLELSQ
ncbi:hypothetical protein CRE_04551 [Caenorhabditis remanei]|uniref:Uncharacterized protein n=2 Tax=Caenorhabditis remanei TaxID=31234 RepID=E3LZ16_CAERE|nr:hypothetical protein CRE_04551 [Caenorhabditis remanei]